MSEFGIGKFGKNSGINLTSFRSGLKKDAMKTDEQKSIFDSIDTDKNGVIDENELEKFKNSLDSSQDNVVSKKEAKKYMKSNDLKNIDKKELLKFLQSYNENTENVQDVKVTEQNGQKIVQVTYKDGSQEIINPDKSSRVITKDENNNITTQFLDADKKLQKTIVESESGDVVETMFAQDGKTPESTITKGKDGSVSTVLYENGKPVSKEVKLGLTTSNYTFDENGNEVLNSKIENEGIANKERKTLYTYGEDGTVTENITEPNGTSVRVSKNGVTISEDINENGKTAHRTYYEKGYEESTTDDKGNPTVNVRSLDHKNLAQQKTIDGKTYSVLYDGEGNTKIIVQNGESPAAIAKKFGCSVEDLKALNSDVLNGKSYFTVGAEIKVPGELEADAPQLQGRKTAEEAQMDYAKAAAKEAQLRAMGLKNHNGHGTKITGKYSGGKQETFTVVGEAGNGRRLARSKDGKYVTISHDGIVLKDEYVQLTNLYANGKKISGTVKVKDKAGNIRTETRQYVKIADMCKGRSVVIDSKGKQHIMSHDGKILDNNYVVRDQYADKIKSDPKEARKATLNMMSDQVEAAQAAFDRQMAEDGWAGDVADGISILWGSENRASVVRKDLALYRRNLEALRKTAESGDEHKFALQFKALYGVEYNQKAIADYMLFPTDANYRKAFGTRNDIGKRVADYNQSQQTGAAVVKGAATVAAGVAIGVATGGTGLVALGAAAAATTASSVAINASDRLSSDVGLRDGEMTQIMKDGLWDGASVLAGGAIGKGARVLIKGSQVAAKGSGQVVRSVNAATGAAEQVSRGVRVARATVSAAGDVGFGAVQEYVQTGEVSVTGTLLNAGLGAVGIAAEGGVFRGIKNKLGKALHGSGPDVPSNELVRATNPDIPGGSGAGGPQGAGAAGSTHNTEGAGRRSTADGTGSAHNTEGAGRRSTADGAGSAHNTDGAGRRSTADGAGSAHNTDGAGRTGAADGAGSRLSPEEIKQKMDNLEVSIKEGELAQNLQTKYADILDGNFNLDVNNPAEVKAFKSKIKAMMIEAHPDRGGSHDIAAEVNAVFSALGKGTPDAAKLKAALERLDNVLDGKTKNLASNRAEFNNLKSMNGAGAGTAADGAGSSSRSNAADGAGSANRSEGANRSSSADGAGTSSRSNAADGAGSSNRSEGANRSGSADGAGTSSRSNAADGAGSANRSEGANRSNAADGAGSANRSEGANRSGSADGAGSANRSEGANRSSSADGAGSANRSEGANRSSSADGAGSSNRSEGANRSGSTDGAGSANRSEGAARTSFKEKAKECLNKLESFALHDIPVQYREMAESCIRKAKIYTKQLTMATASQAKVITNNLNNVISDMEMLVKNLTGKAKEEMESLVNSLKSLKEKYSFKAIDPDTIDDPELAEMARKNNAEWKTAKEELNEEVYDKVKELSESIPELGPLAMIMDIYRASKDGKEFLSEIKRRKLDPKLAGSVLQNGGNVSKIILEHQDLIPKDVVDKIVDVIDLAQDAHDAVHRASVGAEFGSHRSYERFYEDLDKMDAHYRADADDIEIEEVHYNGDPDDVEIIDVEEPSYYTEAEDYSYQSAPEDNFYYNDDLDNANDVSNIETAGYVAAATATGGIVAGISSDKDEDEKERKSPKK